MSVYLSFVTYLGDLGKSFALCTTEVQKVCCGQNVNCVHVVQSKPCLETDGNQ